jgi:hypothetical protein
MRRPVLRVGLVALAAVMPVDAALANGSGDVSCLLPPVATAQDPPPVGPGPCPGVRPGGRVVTSIADCTLNFLFRAPDGTRYIGTAGHCVDPGGASNEESSPDGRGHIERVWTLGKGPAAADSDGQRFGEFAYAIVNPLRDFALIRLDPGVKASPEMCHFGAPRGLSTTDTDTAILLRYYGHGAGISDVAPARTAVAIGTPDPDHIYAVGVAVPGDSGAGVMTADGQAIGALVTTGFHGFAWEPRDPDETPIPHPRMPHADEKGVDAGTIGITRLGPQLARASEQLGLPLTLVSVK